MFKHFLVPVDGSASSDRLVDLAVQAARRTGARITFFHVSADFGASGDGALAHAAWPDDFKQLANAQALTILSKAGAVARAMHVSCHAEADVGGRVHELIHAAALRQGCDVIFVAPHPGSLVARMLHRSSTERLLAIAQVPVLVAGVQLSAPASDQDYASRILRDEHRSLATVLHALQDVLDRSSTTGQPLDGRLIRAMLYYIEVFPERLHHPKEEAFIFNALRLRAPDYVALMDKLQVEHQTGRAQIETLRAALQVIEGDASQDKASFFSLAQQFVEGQLSHMALEEQTLMPAAREYLLPEDWTAIRQAFEDNADPRFGVDADESFNHLLGRILSLAQAGSTSP